MIPSSTCPKCGGPNPAGAKFCSFCGSSLSGRPKKRFPVVLVVVSVLLVLAAVLFYLWWSGQLPLLALRAMDVAGLDPCSRSKVDAYSAEADPIMARWQPALELADSSPRIALSAPIRDLQDIRADFAEIVPPDCLALGHRQTLEGMDGIIAGFLGFMAQEDDETVNDLFDEGLKKMRWGLSATNKVRAETP